MDYPTFLEHAVRVQSVLPSVRCWGNATNSGSCDDKNWAAGSHEVKCILARVAHWCQQGLSHYAAMTFTLDHVGWSAGVINWEIKQLPVGIYNSLDCKARRICFVQQPLIVEAERDSGESTRYDEIKEVILAVK